MSEDLLIVTQATGSGMGRFAVELANSIAAAGGQVAFAAPDQPYALAPAVAPVPARSPTGVTGRRKTIALAMLSLDLARAAWRRCARRVPMLMVHVAPTLPVSLLPLLAARLRGARIALSVHDFYPHTFRFPPRLRGLERALYRFAYRSCDLLVTNNPEQAARLEREAGVPRARIEALYHGVFTVPGIAPPAEDAETTLLVFGSLRPNKRVLESIEAVRALRAAGVPVRLRIAGAPRREDADYWAACRAALPADGAGFEVDARFIADEELPAIFSNIAAFLCPYFDFDSQSGVAMTAVSNGVPMIATRAAKAAMADMDGDAWTPIAEPPSAEAIAAAIRAFMAVPRARRLAAAADLRARLLDTAGWPRLGGLYLKAMRARDFFGR